MIDVMTIVVLVGILVAIAGSWIQVLTQAGKSEKDARDWNDYNRDYKATSTYASYFLSAIVVFFGLILREEVKLSDVSLLYFLQLWQQLSCV